MLKSELTDRSSHAAVWRRIRQFAREPELHSVGLRYLMFSGMK